MSEDLPHHQHLSGVSTQNHSQAFVGVARNVYFPASHDPQETSEQAALACRHALFLTHPDVDRETVISAKGERVAGTCEWITRDKNYLTWLDSDGDGNDNDDTRLLWISGGPGKGKTMMSIFLTEKLAKHTERMDDTELVFFFCSAQDEKRNTAVAVLRGLVHRIIAKRPQLVKHALPYFDTPEKTQQALSSLETLWLIFSKLVVDAELRRIFCVLDGLDECEESTLRALLPRIVGLLTGETSNESSGTFKLAIVSRDIPQLRACTRIRLDPDNDEKVRRDIELFVSARVQELQKIEGFKDDFQLSVQTALLARAEGTFLWVGFAMHELLQKQTCSEIWEALEDLPSGLPAIYGRMLLRIPAKRREISCAILRWVTMAVRPLQLQELAAAVEVQVTSPWMTTEQAARDAVASCGPLLKLQEQEVSLVHQSARDYLLRDERDSDAVLEAFRVDPSNAHLELARKCLSCIALSSLRHRALGRDAKLHRESPPLLYATIHWPEHATSCSALAAKLLDPSTLFFQKQSSLRDHWWKTYSDEQLVFRYTGLDDAHISLLEMAIFIGIVPWVEAVLAMESWTSGFHGCVNTKNNAGETVLHIAVLHKNDAVVRLLVDSEADVKAENEAGWTALHIAAGEGNEAIVQLLIDRGADVNAKGNDGRTVLHMAAEEGDEAVVQLLLDLGADVNAKDNDGETVLHWAAWWQRQAVVQLLVDLGADVNAKTKYGETVLHRAAKGGDKAVVQLLLDLRADVNAKTNNGETVLHAAAEGGDKAVVQLLLNLGADVNAKTNNGEMVLHIAAKGGNKAVVQLLVDFGADVNAKTNKGKTVLQMAHSSPWDRETVVELLKDRGAR